MAMLIKWKNTHFPFVSDNGCEDIEENWSDRLDELDSIQKRKQLEIRTNFLRDQCGIHLMLHTSSIYYGHTNVDLLGVLFSGCLVS